MLNRPTFGGHIIVSSPFFYTHIHCIITGKYLNLKDYMINT